MSNGVWKEENYEISYETTTEGLHVSATFNGKIVGEVTFIEISTGEILAGGGKDELEPFVEPKHRRKGLMTEMYRVAEKALNKKAAPSGHQSSLGESFWNQKKRPFG